MTDIQPTSGDRIRFEAIIKCLIDGGTNLAVLSEYDEVLDHFARQIQLRLTEAIRCDIEFCASTNSEQLVQKFNQLLGQLSIDQALDKDAAHAPRRYLVFRDSILTQEFELQLLARLVKAFPAGNISVILLINSAHNHRGKLEAFGKNLLKWYVETRAGVKREPLRDLTLEAPTEPPVLQDVVADVGHGLAAATSAEPLVPFERREPALVISPLEDTPEAPVSATQPTAASGRRFPWSMLVGVMLLSVVTVAWLYRERIVTELEALRQYVTRGTPAPASVPVRAEVAAPAEDTPAAPQAEASAPPVAEEKEEVIESSSRRSEAVPAPAHAADKPSAEQPLADKPVAEKPAAEKPVAEKGPADKPVVEKLGNDKVVSEKPAAQTKPAPAVTGTAWEDQLQPGTYVVQLAAFDTKEETLTFQKGHAVYANARVLKVRNKSASKTYFVLVAGPMANKAEAEAFMRSHPLVSKGWLRSSKSLKAQL